MPADSSVLHHIEEIFIPNESHSFLSVDEEKTQFLGNLEKINIFVGENNSGKSRLLRDFLKNDIRYKPTYSLNLLNESLIELKTDLLSEFKKLHSKPFPNLVENLDGIGVINDVGEDFDLKKNLDKLKNYTNSLCSQGNTTTDVCTAPQLNSLTV